MSDILNDYREWAAWQLPQVRTHSERCHMWRGHEACMIHRLARALEAATLTETEREAVKTSLRMCGDPSPLTAPSVFRYAATLRGLLERHFPASENGEKKETTHR